MPKFSKGATDEFLARTKELKEQRERAYSALDRNPNLKPPVIAQMYGVSKSTATSWKSYWLKHVEHGRRPNAIIAPPAKPPVKPTPPPARPKLTFEEIVAAIPDTATLGLILVEGFNKALEDRDFTIKGLEEEKALQDDLVERVKMASQQATTEKNRILQAHNELLAKLKVGTVTVDKVSRRLVQKEC